MAKRIRNSILFAAPWLCGIFFAGASSLASAQFGFVPPPPPPPPPPPAFVPPSPPPQIDYSRQQAIASQVSNQQIMNQQMQQHWQTQQHMAAARDRMNQGIGIPAAGRGVAGGNGFAFPNGIGGPLGLGLGGGNFQPGGGGMVQPGGAPAAIQLQREHLLLAYRQLQAIDLNTLSARERAQHRAASRKIRLALRSLN